MEYQSVPKKNSFATASMVLGILALLTLGTVFLPLPLGSLGILFAVLSMRKGIRKEPSCMAGIITSAISLAVSLFLIITSVSMLPAMLKDPTYRKQLDIISEQLYGDSFDDMVEELYGIDPDDLFTD